MPKLNLDSLRSRKPAKRMAEIPADVLSGLSSGIVESMNLVEWLAVDRWKLFECLESEVGLQASEASRKGLKLAVKGQTALKASMSIGKHLSTVVQVGDPAWRAMEKHTSDIVREWAAIVVGHSALSFPKKLAWVKPFADDPNAGLREIAWLALRADVLLDPINSIRSLVPWTGSRQERLRRYASEITRPCGVWTSHISVLKQQPELGIGILEPLRSDESKYVKDSVANWLNDASKSKPEWVREVTERWLCESDTAHTQYIVRRSLRTLDKKS